MTLTSILNGFRKPTAEVLVNPPAGRVAASAVTKPLGVETAAAVAQAPAAPPRPASSPSLNLNPRLAVSTPFGENPDVFTALDRPLSTAEAPGEDEVPLSQVYEVKMEGKTVHSSNSPALTLAVIRELRRQLSFDPLHSMTQEPRLVGMTYRAVQLAAESVSEDSAAWIKVPHNLLDALWIPGTWNGSGIEFHVVAGQFDKIRVQTKNWREALVIGREAIASGVPVEIKAAYHGNKVVFMKSGQTFGERHKSKREAEEAAAKAAAVKIDKTAIATEERTIEAKIQDLNARSHKRSGLAFDLN